MQVLSLETLGPVIQEFMNSHFDPRVVVGGNFGTPYALLDTWDKNASYYRLFAANAQPPFPDRAEFQLETVFVGPAMRGKEGLAYYPYRLGIVPQLFKDVLAPDVVLVQTSLIYDHKVSLGIEVNILPTVIREVHKRGGLVIGQVNRHMPYTLGDGEFEVEAFDYLIREDAELPSPPEHKADDAEIRIASYVSELIPNGAYLQGGIGPVVNEVMALLGSHHDLVGFSEMFGDWIMELSKAGALSITKMHRASFAFGSQEFYQWLDHNQDIEMRCTEYMNDPAVIAHHPRTVSINTAAQYDLYAQAQAMIIKGRVQSGFGGKPDYVEGALRSKDGIAIIAMRSWHPKANVSTIVPVIDGPATSFGHTYLVTEFGRARIAGETLQQSRTNIANVSHPNVRDLLRQEV